MENKKKSQFLPPLASRDGLDYPPPGEWKRSVSLNKLAVLAKNLDTSKAKDRPDKLHSIPTPWARLLLFESALYDKEHPAHTEVVSQWRAMLALLGLADVLDLANRLDCPAFNLSKEPAADIRNAFMTLRPKHKMPDPANPGSVIDTESGKWETFNFITLDGVVVGATSPRTIVFTGIRAQCPAGLPEAFRSAEGLLTDPTEFYRANDATLLSILWQWVDQFERAVEADQSLARYLGHRPSDRGAQPILRHGLLIRALSDWRDSFKADAVPMRIRISLKARLSKPFDFIKPVAPDPELFVKSDLFLKGHKDVIVCFRPENNSMLFDQNEAPVTDQPIRIYGLHQTRAGQPLPRNVQALVGNKVRVIEDPAALLEDSLIEVDITQDAALVLSYDKRQFLVPLRRETLDLLSEAAVRELVSSMSLKSADQNTIALEMQVPLESGGVIRVYKEYSEDKAVIAGLNTQGLIRWPDFVCKEGPDGHSPFRHYFYYTSDISLNKQVTFTPLLQTPLIREIDKAGLKRKWYMSEGPLSVFSGSVNGRQGLLLLRYTRVVEPPELRRLLADATHADLGAADAYAS